MVTREKGRIWRERRERERENGGNSFKRIEKKEGKGEMGKNIQNKRGKREKVPVRLEGKFNELYKGKCNTKK